MFPNLKNDLGCLNNYKQKSSKNIISEHFFTYKLNELQFTSKIQPNHHFKFPLIQKLLQIKSNNFN